MSLAERLAKAPVDPHKQFCEIGKVLDKLARVPFAQEGSADEYTALVNALKDPAWAAPAISMALVEEGFGSVNVRHIRQHRRGEHTEANCLDAFAGRTATQ